MNVTDSQGSKLYLAAYGTDVADVLKIETAIATAKQVGCLQDLGEITTSRSVQEYSCLSEDNVTKSLGSLTLGNQTIGLLFDAKDAAGQADLVAAFNATTSSGRRRVAILQLNDEGTTNPTYITYDIAVSSLGVAVAKDNAVMRNFTVEVMSKPVEKLAV
jgi:hypothetical protein